MGLIKMTLKLYICFIAILIVNPIYSFTQSTSCKNFLEFTNSPPINTDHTVTKNSIFSDYEITTPLAFANTKDFFAFLKELIPQLLHRTNAELKVAEPVPRNHYLPIYTPLLNASLVIVRQDTASTELDAKTTHRIINTYQLTLNSENEADLIWESGDLLQKETLLKTNLGSIGPFKYSQKTILPNSEPKEPRTHKSKVRLGFDLTWHDQKIGIITFDVQKAQPGLDNIYSFEIEIFAGAFDKFGLHKIEHELQLLIADCLRFHKIWLDKKTRQF